MSFAHEVRYLFQKELLLEWRQKYAFNGILLYVAGAIFICYLSFGLRIPEKLTWNALFWVILLFSAVNGIAKSFQQEREGRTLFYYQLASPAAIILAKILYNTAFMSLIALLGYGIFSVLLNNPVQDQALFVGNLLLGALSYACVLTLVSGIAAKSSSSGTLMAVLGFPLVLPVTLLLVRLSKNAMDGLARSASTDELLTILAIDAIVLTLSLILFPFLWRS